MRLLAFSKTRSRGAVLAAARAVLLAVFLTVTTAACEQDPGAEAAPESGAPTPTVNCEETPIQRAALPEWTASANPPDLPFVMSVEENLVGVLFANPLRAGEPDPNGPSNKILWIAREPRDGMPLELVLTPLEGAGDPVTVTQPANSSPGEIYPSIVTVPAPGCWAVTASWNENTATLALPFE